MARTQTSFTQTENGPPKRRPAILLRKGVLDQLFADTGIDTLNARARALGYSPGALSVAANGGSVGPGLVRAICRRFPLVEYRAVFIEGVPTYEPVHRNAA